MIYTLLTGEMTCFVNLTFSSVACVSTSDIPRVFDAQFAESLVSISILFDVPTNIPTGSCDQMFSPNTLLSLGSDPFCAWSSTMMLMVYLGQDAIVQPGDSLTMLGEFLKSADLHSDFAPSTNFSVRAPDDAPAVKAVLVGPTIIGMCDDLTMDTSMSLGGAGRPFGVEWFVSADLNPTVNLTSLLNLNHTLVQKTDEVVLVLNKEELTYVSNIVFQAKLTNWLLSTDTVSFQVIKESASLPSVSSTSPALDLYSFEELSLQSISTAPVSCGSDSSSQSNWQWDVAYLWTQLSGPDLALSAAATTTSRLVRVISCFYPSLL